MRRLLRPGVDADQALDSFLCEWPEWEPLRSLSLCRRVDGRDTHQLLVDEFLDTQAREFAPIA